MYLLILRIYFISIFLFFYKEIEAKEQEAKIEPSIQFLNGTRGFFDWGQLHRLFEGSPDLFAPPTKVLDKVLNKYAHILSQPNVVAMHIKSPNQDTPDSNLNLLGLGCFRRTMALFPPNSLFVVFSNRIDWCKQHLPKEQCVFIEENEHLIDFYLTSLIKKHIISNSCDSLWMNYLNHRPEKILIAPECIGRSTYLSDPSNTEEAFSSVPMELSEERPNTLVINRGL